MTVPWWALSPSPFSVAFYLVFAFWGYRRIQLLDPKRRVVAAAESLLVLAVVVLVLDTVWLAVCGWRWGYLYPADVPHLWLCAGRNLAGVALCGLLVFPLAKKSVVGVNKRVVLAFVLNVGFMVVWFWGASSPALTDWQYSIRHGFPWSTTLQAFLISHVAGKIVSMSLFVSVFAGKTGTTL